MLKTSLYAIALLAFAGSGLAADNNKDWQLHVKNKGNRWAASFNGPQDYGPAGKP